MNQCKNSKLYFLLLSMGSLSVALISFSGIVMKEDIVGRIIIGCVWLLVSVGWIGRFFHTKKNENAV